MSTTSETHLQNWQQWHDEIDHLLAQPIKAAESINREGKTVGLRVTPSQHAGQAVVDLFVSLFFLYLSPPKKEEIEADQAALRAFLEGLRDADYHIRVAACEALGQLGDPAARDALQTALHDENRYVCAAAARALAALDIARGRAEDLAGLRLVLWRQSKHLRVPVGITETNQRGQARFPNTPADATCCLQLLERERQGRTTLAAQTPRELAAEGTLAAAGGEVKTQSLPHSQRLALDDGSLLLLCTLYRNDQGRVVMKFRSDAPQLQDGWVHFTATSQRTKEEILREFMPLKPNARGILTGRFVLSDVLDLRQEYEIHFEPLPAP